MNLFVDLDGSMFDNTHRLALLPTGDGTTTEQWAAFNNACGGDSVIEETREFFYAELPLYDKVIIVTGRADCSRKPTMQSLLKHGIPYNVLEMRPDDDHRKAVDFKRDVYNAYGLKQGDLVIEDDPAIIEMIAQEFPGVIVYEVESRCAAVQAGMSQK